MRENSRGIDCKYCLLDLIISLATFDANEFLEKSFGFSNKINLFQLPTKSLIFRFHHVEVATQSLKRVVG